MVLEDIHHLIQRIPTETPAVSQGLSGGLDIAEATDWEGPERHVTRAALADQLLELGATFQVEGDLALDGLLSRPGERRPLPEGQNPHLCGWIRRQIDRLDAQCSSQRNQNTRRRHARAAFVLGQCLLGDHSAHCIGQLVESETTSHADGLEP
ncbi:MAG: hypothetical protein WC709_07500 [Thermoleophilia bacterium]